jgi:chemotaxis receptor (MCP) glutamine deamidase CheD
MMCNNLTMVSGLNHNLLPNKLPKIKYEQAEVYWQKKYGEKRIKSKRSELVYSTDMG